MKFSTFGPHVAAAAVFSLAAGSAFAAGPEMIVNGSFESPAYGAAGVYSGGGDGWTKSFFGPVSIINGNIKDGGGHRYGETPFGEQYLGLDPRSSQGFYAADSQTIPGFVAGQRYAIALGAADSDGGKAAVLEVILSDGGSKNYFDQSFDLPVGGPYGTKILFTKLHAVFKAPVTGDIVLTLRNSGINFPVGDPGSISIDRVSVHALSDEEADALEAADGAVKSSAFQR